MSALAMNPPRMESPNPHVANAAPWLLLGGLALLGWGFHASSLLDVWAIGRAREMLELALAGVIVACAVVALRRWRMANALGLAAVTAHMAAVGPVPLLGALLLAAAALALGDGLARRAGAGPMIALIVGLALIAATVGWLLPLKLHRDWVYALSLGAVVVLRRHALLRQLHGLQRQWRHAVNASPRLAALGVLALGLAATPAWLPTLQFDDLAYHLGLPAQLQALSYYRMDAASQVWALAPWAGDVLQGIVQVLVDAEARGSVNLVWLCVSAWLLAALCRASGLSQSSAWLGVILFASLPMTALLTGGMQTEGPGTAVLLGLALLIQRHARRAPAPALKIAAVLAGLLLGLKASFGLPLLLLGGWLLWQWRGRVPWHALTAALALGFLVGGSSYIYAWTLSGNPLLPLFNALFGSPLFPETNFFDPRYSGRFGADMLWRLVFETDRMMESWPGVGGFQMIGLGLLLPLAFIPQRTRGLAAVATLMFVALLLMAQYLRYAHPAMVLLLVPMLAGLQTMRWRRLAVVSVLALAVLNLAFQANSSWILRLGATAMLVNAGGNPEPLMERFAPERLLVRGLPRHARVLVAGRPYHAELAGRGFSPSWYDTELHAAARALMPRVEVEALRMFLVEHGFTHVIVGGEPAIPGLRERLEALGATRVDARYDAALWVLPDPGPVERRDLTRERNLATRLRRAWR